MYKRCTHSGTADELCDICEDKRPFIPGQRVCVPGRYNRMIVQRVWRGRLPGDWHVQAEFESGYGMYVGYAHEFKDGWT